MNRPARTTLAASAIAAAAVVVPLAAVAAEGSSPSHAKPVHAQPVKNKPVKSRPGKGGRSAALTWRSGTAELTETMPDGSPITPLGYWDGVPIAGSAFGSAWAADPRHPGYFWGLTDRGPNVTAPDGSAKLEPLDGFQDTLGYFHLVGGTLQLVRTVGLTLADGEPTSGLENVEADAGETILNQYGQKLPSSSTGLDTEGLVVMPDGSFWISDEYGPYLVHFGADGKEITRLDPYVATAGHSDVFDEDVSPLPSELKHRMPNKGMEGLTITPDGKYLVGLMQSSLQKNGTTQTASKVGAITRIVKVSLTDPSDVHEYLYELHDAKGAEGEANSEITALSDGTFLVDERDGNFEPGADKNLWRIDLSRATDVGPKSPLIGTSVAGGAVTYDPSVGLEVGGQSIEDIAGQLPGLPSPSASGWQTRSGAPTGQTAGDALAADGINVAAESLYLNYSGLVSSIDPTGMYFGHDKVEGVAIDPSDPHKVYLSNDSDFGITDLPAGPDPTAEHRAKGTDAEKFLPDGKTQDFGEVLEVDLSRVPAAYRG